MECSFDKPEVNFLLKVRIKFHCLDFFRQSHENVLLETKKEFSVPIFVKTNCTHHAKSGRLRTLCAYVSLEIFSHFIF